MSDYTNVLQSINQSGFFFSTANLRRKVPTDINQLTALRIFVCTCAGLRHTRIRLLGAQVLTHHLLERAHEHRDEAVNVTGIVAASRLQNHQSS